MNVTIGIDNKVRWQNEDVVQVSILADDDSDSEFYNTTHDASGGPTLASSLYPSETFEYTFTKPATYGYHCSFHPWMRGSVTVLSEK
jgi:plastocyanin